MNQPRNQQTKTARTIAIVMMQATIITLILAALGVAPQLTPIALGLLVVNAVLLVIFK